MSICQSCYMDFSKLLQVFLPHFLLALAGGQEHQLDEEQDDELVNIITMMQNGFRCLDVTINNAYMLMSLLFTFLSPQKSFTYFFFFEEQVDADFDVDYHAIRFLQQPWTLLKAKYLVAIYC